MHDIPRFVSANTLARERLQLPGMRFIKETKFVGRAIRHWYRWAMPSAAPMARRSAKGLEVDRPEFSQAVSGFYAAYRRSWRKSRRWRDGTSGIEVKQRVGLVPL